MLNLHNLPKDKSATDRKKRLGRGNASGSGNYSGRGMKGQKARSGGKSGLALRSIKSYLLRIPKTRGFRSLKTKMAVVNVVDLDKHFNNEANINARDMLKAGLIATIINGVKILSNGKLNKQFTIEANAFSAAAKAQIEKAGGKAIIVGVRPKPKAGSFSSKEAKDKDSK